MDTPLHASMGYPDQCWPYCDIWRFNIECQGWFGPGWYYCGYSNGWVYCCSNG